MKIASVADVKAKLSAYLDECESKGPVVITRNGKAVAVLVAPANDDDLETRYPKIWAKVNQTEE